MPTPLPRPGTENLEPPDADQARFVAQGIASACRLDGGLTELQSLVLGAIARSMTGHEIDTASLSPISASEFAEGLADRNAAFRTRLLQLMELGHMILPEPSVAVADRVIDFARELSIENDCVHMARELAEGSRQLVAADIDRSRYLMNLDLSGFTPLQTEDDKNWAWTNTAIKPELAARWRSLRDHDEGTLGRMVHSFYEARGFRFPGEEGSAPPLLAQHDFVHVIADYASNVESELEVFAFIARSSDDPAAFALLAMVINLFQTGQLEGAAGIFDADPGHLDAEGMPERLADAFRRGALTHGSQEFLATNFWEHVDRPIGEVREHFGVVAKSELAADAGSLSPWDPEGMSIYQQRAGRELAAEHGRPYDDHGASVSA
ncbi:MAG: hypothetical protein AAFZ07_08220 [Actinomycetota bacterium]